MDEFRQDLMVDCRRVETDLAEQGFSIVRNVLTAESCDAFKKYYDDPSIFRSKVKMARHNFGKGEYQYFSYPLPEAIEQLRQQFYRTLFPIANHWSELLKKDRKYPASLEGYLEDCHALGQTKATPLMLKYEAGDFNCLHQDVYGEEVFPLQVAFALSCPVKDYAGGEFVLTSQRPRMQSVVNVVSLNKGDAVIFAVNERPCQGTRGIYRVKMRHGVSKVLSGDRSVLGLIFHDAS